MQPKGVGLQSHFVTYLQHRPGGRTDPGGMAPAGARTREARLGGAQCPDNPALPRPVF